MNGEPTAARVRLIPLRGADFAAWTAESVRGYAAQQVAAGVNREPDASDHARRQLRELLPYGPVTPGHCVWSVHDGGGASVGRAWLQLRRLPTGVEGYLLDIDVAVPRRRRGVGRAAMLAVEEEARRRGAVAMRLNVFGHNVAARALYAGLGYSVVEATWVLELPGRPTLRPGVHAGATASGQVSDADLARARRRLQLQHRDDGLHALTRHLELDAGVPNDYRGGPALLHAVQRVAAECGVRTLTVVVDGSSSSTRVLLDGSGFSLTAETMAKPL